MSTIDALIEEITRCPVIHSAQPISGSLACIVAGAAPAQAAHGHWEWYDSSYELQTGLDVTEHQIPAALCSAVFQGMRRFPNPIR